MSAAWLKRILADGDYSSLIPIAAAAEIENMLTWE